MVLEWGLTELVKPRVVSIHSVLEGKGKLSLLVRPITKSKVCGTILVSGWTVLEFGPEC